MVEVLSAIKRGYIIFNNEWSDPRTNNWPLMSTPFLPLAIMIGYAYGTTSWGPRLMKNRKPFELRRIIMLYNILQVMANMYLFIKEMQLCWPFVYDWRCEPVDYSSSEHAIAVATMSYEYFLVKICDLFDTVFFVLRKKNNQVSFLHIYHHTGMICVSWICVKFLAGGHGTFVGWLNTFVHTVMYFYYFLTTWDLEYKKSIWWKKHLTQLQMVQFLLIFFHQSQLLFRPECKYPWFIALLMCPLDFLLLILFVKFYINNYLTKEKQS